MLIFSSWFAYIVVILLEESWKVKAKLSDQFTSEIKGHDLFLPNTKSDLLKEHQAEERTQTLYTFGVIEEGDIKVTELFHELKAEKKTNFWSQSNYHWDRTAVPYKINSDFSTNLKNPSCDPIVDVGFIIDSSGSLRDQYHQEIEFLINLAKTFNISKNGAHAGVITFSSRAVLNIKLNQYYDQEQFEFAIDEIAYMGYVTRIDLALRKALEMFDEINGARKNIPQLLFLLTDGEQYAGDGVVDENPANVAQLVRDRGIEIIAVGIGSGVNQSELNTITGSTEKVFLAENFDELINKNFLKRIKDGTCLGNTENEFKLHKSNLLATLSVIEEEFIISFEIKPTLYSRGLHSVFRIELENDRYIAVWFSDNGSGTLIIKSVFGTIDDEVQSNNDILLSSWTAIKISQQRLNNKYIYMVEIGGKILFSKENLIAKSFSSVAVYAADKENIPQDGFIRSLSIKNGNEGFILKQEKSLIEKTVIATLPKLENQFVLSFDVRFNSVQDLYYNVIKFSGSTSSGIYPAFWFHKSKNSKSLSASTLVNNKLVSFDQYPVSFNIWSKVLLAQVLTQGAYMYSININGVEVYSGKQIPVDLNSIVVHASSPDDTAQAGLIRNLKIGHGKKGTLHLESPDCEGFFDVGFILDSSGSLKSQYWKEKDFLKKLANSFGISNKGSHAGVVTFSHNAELSIRLDAFYSSSDFNDAVDRIRHMNSVTRIDLALAKALELFDTKNGARSDVPNLLFLLTDGEQYPEMPLTHISDEIKQKGIQLFAVGIGSNIKSDSLEMIVGKPENVFMVDDFDKLLNGDFLKKVKQGSCSSVLENLKKETELKKDNLLVTLWLKKEFIVSFDIKPTLYLPGYHSVLRLEIGNGKYISVWFSELGVGILVISSVFGTIKSDAESKKPIPLNEWTSIKISQQFINSKYMYTVEIAEDIIFFEENGLQEEFTSVGVYASESDHLSQSGFIRNLKVKNGNEGYMLRKETQIERGKLLGTIAELEMEYEISFEVKPESKESLLNVFQITHSKSSGGANNELLAMWLDENHFGKLTSENKNFVMNFPDQMPTDKWMTIRIAQQFFNNKYLCEVDLNGKEVLSTENFNADYFTGLTFYAASPNYNPASGFIRNILLINGHIDVELRKVVNAAISDFNDFTCIKFVPHDNHNDYLSFVAKEGCFSEIGKVGGEQKISIGTECRWKGTVSHLIMHSLGFLHETSRIDRNKAITVLENNMDQKFRSNFHTYNADQTLGLHYDYFSIMHYGAYAFSNNRQPTIRSLFPNIGVDMLGQRDGFSELDIKRIKEAYKCDNGNTDSIPITTPIPLTTPSLTPLPLTTPASLPPQTTTTLLPLTTPSALVTTKKPDKAPVKPVTPSSLPTTVPTSTSLPVSPLIPTTLLPLTTPPTLPSTKIPIQTSKQPSPSFPSTLSTRTTKKSFTDGDLEPTSAITLPPSKTPTRVNIATERPCKQKYYPCWPFDFSISLKVSQSCCSGLNIPQNCKCHCLLLNSQQVGRKTEENFLCYKKSLKNPGFLLSEDKHPLKKCIRLPTVLSPSKKFLCYSHEPGYHLRWSDVFHNKNCIQSTGEHLNHATVLCNDF
ncbi:uncharacterized protein LOC101240329 isoform X2 [Hydra vulgaris]|uniref:Metalloendopeptidase n=2 Tax=Hydra vulgaris TaxID=6087 RepID=A0ABM4DE73_HYDVU